MLANPACRFGVHGGTPAHDAIPEYRAHPKEINDHHPRRGKNEPSDVALRRFKRTIEKLGLLTDLRAREFYEKPTAERKRRRLRP